MGSPATAPLIERASRGRRPVVLIDGGSGSGKTTLAGILALGWPGPVRVVHLDDLYPGWSGLAAGSAAVARDVLREAGPGYRRWDWQRSEAAEWVPLDPRAPLIIEGCGTLTAANRRAATFGIWCELDAGERRRRALARDPDTFPPHWDEWEAQEAEHWRHHRPWELADTVWTPN